MSEDVLTGVDFSQANPTVPSLFNPKASATRGVRNREGKARPVI